MTRLKNWYHEHRALIGYCILALAFVLTTWRMEANRLESRERFQKSICDALTTYTRALGAGREFTEEDAKPFLVVVNEDLRPIGCVITFEDIRRR